MVKVHYKKWEQWWFCYTTYNGVDISRKSDFESTSKELMINYLMQKGVKRESIEFIFDGEFEKSKTTSLHSFRRPKLDHL